MVVRSTKSLFSDDFSCHSTSHFIQSTFSLRNFITYEVPFCGFDGAGMLVRVFVCVCVRVCVCRSESEYVRHESIDL